MVVSFLGNLDELAGCLVGIPVILLGVTVPLVDCDGVACIFVEEC